MPEDAFPVEEVGGVPVVAAPEELDITNAEALRSALLTAAAGGHGTLVVDMTRTQFCDSSGLHALLAAYKRAEAKGCEVLLVIPSTAVLRVFAITGVDRMIPNFTSLPEALTHTAATANGPGRQPTTEMPLVGPAARCRWVGCAPQPRISMSTGNAAGRRHRDGRSGAAHPRRVRVRADAGPGRGIQRGAV